METERARALIGRLVGRPARASSIGRVLALALAAGLTIFQPPAWATAGESPQSIVASQIRRQGFACDRALGARHDLRRSVALGQVWILRCHDAAYRVRLMPHLAADVVRLSSDEPSRHRPPRHRSRRHRVERHE